MAEVSYVTITGKEAIEKILLPMVRQVGWDIALPQFASAELAIVESRIVGFSFLQLVAHAEPLWVHPEFRGQNIAERLTERVQKLADAGVKKYVCITRSPYAEKIARASGMKELEGVKVFVKE